MKLPLPGRVNVGNAATALAVAAEFGVHPVDAVRRLAEVTSVAGRYAQVERDGRIIRLLLAKNPASWLEAFEMPEQAPTLLSINARGPDGLDTSWLFDVDFSPLRAAPCSSPATGRTTWRFVWRSTRCRSPTCRPSPTPSPRCRPAGWRSSPTTPPSRTSERSWTVSSESTLRVVWVYPDLLSTYGDRGNLLILAHRAAARAAGGADRGPIRPEAARARRHLPHRRRRGRPASPGGAAAARRRGPAPGGGRRARWSSPSAPATSCSARSFFAKGEKIAGLELLDIHSDRGPNRAVGELAGTVDPRLGLPVLSGFENHGGRTHLGPGVARWPRSRPGWVTTV